VIDRQTDIRGSYLTFHHCQLLVNGSRIGHLPWGMMAPSRRRTGISTRFRPW